MGTFDDVEGPSVKAERAAQEKRAKEEYALQELSLIQPLAIEFSAKATELKIAPSQLRASRNRRRRLRIMVLVDGVSKSKSPLGWHVESLWRGYLCVLTDGRLMKVQRTYEPRRQGGWESITYDCVTQMASADTSAKSVEFEMRKVLESGHHYGYGNLTD